MWGGVGDGAVHVTDEADLGTRDFGGNIMAWAMWGGG